MKTPLICIIVMFLTIAKTHAQSGEGDFNPMSKKHILIALYRENSTIDSLINVAINGTYSPNKYFVFRTIKVGDGYNFYLYQAELERAGVELDLEQDIYSKVLGYFIFKSCIVFITGANNDPYNFFTKTDCLKAFNFMWYKHVNEKIVQRRWKLFHGLYAYKNGKFINSQLSNY